MSNRDYVEHSTPSASNTFNIQWTAPASGTGRVTFYAAGIASNNNGTTSGDAVASSSLAISEGSVTQASELFGMPSIRLLSNPVVDELRLEITNEKIANSQLSILNISGVEIQSEKLSLISGVNEILLPVYDLMPGVYLVRLGNDSGFTTTKFFKN
jgi:hypothetical protein